MQLKHSFYHIKIFIIIKSIEQFNFSEILEIELIFHKMKSPEINGLSKWQSDMKWWHEITKLTDDHWLLQSRGKTHVDYKWVSETSCELDLENFY